MIIQKQKKLFLFIITGIALILSICAFHQNVYAEQTEQYSGTCGDALTWTFENGTLTISGQGDMDDAATDLNASALGFDEVDEATIVNQPWNDIRDKITQIVIADGVTSIGNCAFYGCSNVTSITIPDSVTKIGIGAFEECSSLTSISIPSGVETLRAMTFSGCTSLTNVTLNEGLKVTKEYAFHGCTSLREISIPDSVTVLGAHLFDYCTALETVRISESSSLKKIKIQAFRDTAVTQIYIPQGTTSIHTFAFQLATNLKKIKVSTDNKKYASKKGVLFSKDMKTLLVYPAGKKAFSYQVPKSVKTISEGAFNNNLNLKKVILGKNITTIRYHAFSGSNYLTTVVIKSKKLTSVGKNVFVNYLASSERTITIKVPKSLKAKYKKLFTAKVLDVDITLRFVY